MVTQTEKPTYTPEEYLKLEEQAEFKSEYRNGEIIPMASGTTNHNKIARNFYKRFPLTIQDQDYEVYISDVIAQRGPDQGTPDQQTMKAV